MDDKEYVLTSSQNLPVFSFERLRRCATLDNEEKPHSTEQKAAFSASMSSLENNINSAIFTNHSSNNGVDVQHYSFPLSQSIDLQPPACPSSPQHQARPGPHDQVCAKSTSRPPLDPRHKSTPKVRASSTSSSGSSSCSSSPKSTPTTTPTTTPKFFPLQPSPLRHLHKTPRSALNFNSSPREKPVFRRYLSLIVFPSSLKQIPFTVPASAHTPPSTGGFRRADHRSVDDSSGRSEPTSPTGKRTSVEIPGAYALGSIDPSLYKIADEDDDYDISAEHIGRVWFATEYERETEKLLVTVIKVRNLPTRTQGLDNACDPFVRLYLMPDERRYLQSRFKKKTCNPKFEETFVFQVSHRALADRVLKLTVYDVDRHKRHQVIGHALYPLREHDCENNVRLVIWRDLEREVSESTMNKGELLVSMCYNNHLERLTIGLFETRDLIGTSPTGQSIDTYAKITLMMQNKPVKAKKTEIVKKNSSPNFNESFTFKVAVTSLDTVSVNIAVMQHVSGHKDKQLGRIILGSFMFARGKELDHWNEMIASQREQLTHWHQLS